MRATKFRYHLTVKGGFPIIVEGWMNPPEPDIGLLSHYLDSYEILTSEGKPADFLKLSAMQLKQLEDRIFSHWEAEHGR